MPETRLTDVGRYDRPYDEMAAVPRQVHGRPREDGNFRATYTRVSALNADEPRRGFLQTGRLVTVRPMSSGDLPNPAFVWADRYRSFHAILAVVVRRYA